MSYEKFDMEKKPLDQEGFVVTQPSPDQDCPPRHGNAPPFPEDYLLLSLFTLLCCCTPLGLYAVIRGSHVKVLHAGGFYRQAKDTSRVVRIINLVGVTLGTLLQLAMGILMLVYFILVAKTMRSMRNGMTDPSAPPLAMY